MSQSRTIPTSRAADVVSIDLKIDGESIGQSFNILSISVSKEINRIPWAKVVLLDGSAASQDFPVSNQDLFIPGKEIEILSGYQNDNSTIFKGLILKHRIKVRSDGRPILVIDCQDKAVRMTMGRKSKYFTQLKDSEIIENIINGYAGITHNVDTTNITRKQMVQYQCTDWDFIVSRAEANGKFCFAYNGALSVKAPDLSASPSLSLTYGANILELDAEVDAKQQLRKVTSKTWDYSNHQIIESEADTSETMLNGNLQANDLADTMDLENFVQYHGGDMNEEELREWSNALMLKHRLSKIKGRVKCIGIHSVLPGSMIQLSGIGNRFNGNAFVSGVMHSISDGSWLMDIQFGMNYEWFTETYPIDQKPASGLLAAIKGLQVGIVRQIQNDPDGEDRILVYLPLISNSENGIWARIATLDAGGGRGSFFRPEIGDEVIVGFVNDDPRDSIVLGMLNSSHKPAPLVASDDNHQKGFVTRSQMRLIFDDEKKSVSIETPKGKKITMSDDAGEIELSDEHQNQILMDSNGITIESNGEIKLKAAKDLKIQGLNLDLGANSSLNISASASTEISASGILEIKGSLVKIN